MSGDAGSVAHAAFLRAGFSDPTLVLRWEEIAGPEVARLARPLKFSDGPSGGTLTLRATPGAALFLAHEKRPLCDRINAYLGRPAVTQLKFSQGAFLPPPPKPPRPSPPARCRPRIPAAAIRAPKAWPRHCRRWRAAVKHRQRKLEGLGMSRKTWIILGVIFCWSPPAAAPLVFQQRR